MFCEMKEIWKLLEALWKSDIFRGNLFAIDFYRQWVQSFLGKNI